MGQDPPAEEVSGSVERARNSVKNTQTINIMGSKPKAPKAAPIAAPAKQSSLDIKRTQIDEKKKMRRRFGFQRTIQGGPGNTPLG